MAIQEFLKDWTLQYIKHMDAFDKSILEILEEPDRIVVKHKKKTQTYIPMAELAQDKVKVSDVPLTIVTLNTKANFERLIKDWKMLARQPGLKLIFINPDSSLERKWAICPHTHSRISDDESLRLGLMSLFQTVEEISEADAKRLAERKE